RRADEASRDVEAWLKCKYMRQYLGEEFDGVVSSVTTFGLFVTLNAMYVEGLIHITELGGEYFKFDEARQELRGERTGIKYAIGTPVRVQVSKVDLDARKIDFRMLTEGDSLLNRAMKDKGVDKFDKQSKGQSKGQKTSRQTPSLSEGGKGSKRSSSASRKSSAVKSPIAAVKHASKTSSKANAKRSKNSRRK
nr:S1 RNA-binding domain-containing protein [Polaromonas sp.]MBP9057402.1 S1 RNA-binding domain-containing protein [Polaromonas sp.]